MASQPDLNNQVEALAPETTDDEHEKETASSDTSQVPTTGQNEEINPWAAEKEAAIRQACNLRDFDALVAHATSEGGFLHDDIRRMACKSPL